MINVHYRIVCIGTEEDYVKIWISVIVSLQAIDVSMYKLIDVNRLGIIDMP